jgi:hypothetical protein
MSVRLTFPFRILRRFRLEIDRCPQVLFFSGCLFFSLFFSSSKANIKFKWVTLTDGCYVLRSNVTDWTHEELWEAYVQLTEAELVFRIQKSDFRIRPISSFSQSVFTEL